MILPLFDSGEAPGLSQGGNFGYDVSADGERILYAASNPEAPAQQILVVFNWFEYLKTRKGN